MSNYTITTNFGAKDSLPSTDAGKVIKGSEFTAEFTNIQTAIATKADTAGDTFTGAVTFDAAVTLNADVTFDTNTLFIDVSANKVGIGTTSPDSILTIDKDVSTAYDSSADDAQRSNTNTLLLKNEDGTTNSFTQIAFDLGASNQPIARIAGINTGTSSSALAFVVEGSNVKREAMRIDSSGKVGIGTSSPYVKTEIIGGDLAVGGGAGASNLGLEIKGVPLSAIPSAQVRGYIATADSGIGVAGDLLIAPRTSANASVRFITGTSPTEAMRIDSNGNVGIGTTNPASRLSIHGAADVAHIVQTNTANSQKLEIGNAYSLYTGASGAVSAIASDSVLAFATNDTEAMRIDSSGNVGIGTASPDSILDVVGSDPILTIRDTSTSGADSHATLRLAESGASDSLNLHYDISLDEGHLTFNYDNTGSNATERMRIDSSGNLLVGTTSATAMGTTNTGVVLRDNDSSYFARNSNGTIIAFFSGLGGAGSISLTGNTANYNTTSDERLKENIADSDDAGSKVDSIQIRQFDWKADGSHQDYGVIAQELINVAPEAVSEGDTEEDMMGVDYSKLVPMLIKEVQSLRSRVAELENV